VRADAVRADAVRAAVAAPGPARHAPEPLGAADLWDGFGMWLALHDRTACRLMAPPVDPDDPESDGLAAELLPVRGRAASIGVLDDSATPGLAAVVLDPAADPRSRGPWPVRVRAFGPAGDAAADRLLAAMAAWVEAGRPVPENLRLTVVPAGVDAAVPGDAVVVEQEHCRVLVHLPPPGTPTSGPSVG
jgi:protein-L-isoaspartate(D-aspartate) O-methyltransferase